MTREEFEKLKVGDKVRHALGGIGIVIMKDDTTYTVKDKGLGFNGEVSFAWNEGKII